MEEFRKKKMWLEVSKKSLLPFLYFIFIALSFFFYEKNLKDFAPELCLKHISLVFFLLFLLSVCFFIQKMLGAFFSWYQDEIASKTKTDLDDKFIPLFRRLANLFIWIIALVIFLSRVGVNISALIATLGVSSLAIALAAQDTIANIISGFLIMVDRPFVIGDDIKLPTGEKVKVLEIGIRRSKFRALEDQAIIIVPNVDLSKSRITNYSYAQKRK